MEQPKLRIFTWHIHGSYLFYLAKGNYQIYIPTREDRAPGYGGRGETFPFGDNVIEVPADEVKNREFDCILYQHRNNFLTDQYEILSAEQRSLPRVYVEHDCPREHPTNTKHIVDDPEITLVHVTHFNNLMWDSNRTPTRVIEHGVINPGVPYRGEKKKGIVVINNLFNRGRLLGPDVFLKVREQVPLDLVGMNTGDFGLGEVLHPRLPDFIADYRFFFHPVRYTSLGLAVCEAMMQGIPVVGLATTELSAVITNGHTGIIHTDINYLIDRMHQLLDDHELAKAIGAKGSEVAKERFNINRFAADWEQLFIEVTAKKKRSTLVLH